MRAVRATLRHETHYRERRGRFHRRRRLRLPRIGLLGIVVLWAAVTAVFASVSLSIAFMWYIPDILGVIASLWLASRYYIAVAGIRDRSKLFLVILGSPLLIFFLGALSFPYDEMVFPTYFVIYPSFNYSVSEIGFASSITCFFLPLVLGMSVTLLFALYKASRTIFVVHG